MHVRCHQRSTHYWQGVALPSDSRQHALPQQEQAAAQVQVVTKHSLAKQRMTAGALHAARAAHNIPHTTISHKPNLGQMHTSAREVLRE